MPISQLFILLCSYNIMVLNTLVYIALVIIVIIVIVILLRFLFNVLFVMPVTLDHDFFVKYAASIYLPTWLLLKSVTKGFIIVTIIGTGKFLVTIITSGRVSSQSSISEILRFSSLNSRVVSCSLQKTWTIG